MLKLALPKGNLQEETVRLFRDAYLDINGDEDYAWIDDNRITETAFFRAQEIGKIIEEGYFDVGITGLDWILDSDAKVQELSDLDYGNVRLVSYVLPESRINDPREIRPNSKVMSEYRSLPIKYYTREFGIPIILLPSEGATEQKVKSGMADVGFDNMRTGKTIRKTGLKIIGDPVLYSSARLVANEGSYLQKKEDIDDIKDMIEGARNARNMINLVMNVPGYCSESVADLLPARKYPTISRLYSADEEWYAMNAVVNKYEAKYLIPQLKRAGAQDIIGYYLTNLIR